jgi:predicted ester cyclase
MSSQQNRSTLERARDEWNAGSLDAYLQLYDPTIVLHGYAGVSPGISSVRQFYQGLWAAFPGSKLIFDDLFASGDKVACRFVVQATHLGPFQGIPPTGKPVNLPGITILRFADGKCVERWSQADFLGLLSQLGALPGSPSAS